MRGCSNSALAPDSEAIGTAARILAAGGLVAYPTETVYGLGTDGLNEAALLRLVTLKVREPGKPIAVLVSDTTMLRDLVNEIPPPAARLMRQFWPGPLTLVLRPRPGVSPLLTGGSAGIGVRISSHPTATAVVRALGRPVTAPSANPARRRAPTRIEDVRRYFGADVDFYLDGGTLQGEPASTVVDVRGELSVLREGAVRAADIRVALRGQV